MALNRFNLVTFSAEAEKDLIPAWKDYVNHYRKENFSTKKSVNMNRTLEEKEALVNKAAMAEIAKFANVDSELVGKAQMCTNPQYRWGFFAIVNKLVDVVLPDILTEDYFNIAEVMTVGRGNTAKIDVKGTDLFVVETNGRSRRHVRAQKQFDGEVYLNPVNHSVTVQVDLYKVMCGIESLAAYAMKVALSIENEMALDILYGLENSYASLTANFKEASFTPNAFKTLATRVSAANGGAKAVAIGTEIALQDVLPTDAYLKLGLGETYNSVGYLPVFLNTPLIGLAQKIDWASEDYEFAVKDNQIYFISPSAGKLVQVAIEDEGLYIEDGAFDNANLTINATFHKSWAVALATGAKYGIMQV